ncbi:molybdopterin oxidoreductase family protein [Thermithiobacillus plumbiphilus]|uniref:Molybdopterin oxidoreductase family protein n=1 Tax=Thermithiobacillus plumbiphilus TaxID=1729899 RepID=A0ABU9DD63_9PROT
MPSGLKFEDHSKQQIKYTTCYMCACRCGIKVTLEDNKVRFIQGNRDHPINRGVLCAKGSAGIMKQYSPAKLRNPLLRKPGSERGSSEFVEISWDEAINLLTDRLAKIRATDPKKLAFFTGRDQMQALTGLWAQQYGTINWSAHGGFCSVNMASAGLYMLGHAFWEFGDPDWDLTKYFMLWGVAEDHNSNPIKIGLEKVKRNGAKFVSINPVRTGYSAIADEWVPIRPGTDGMLALSMVHVLLSRELFDWEFMVRYSNAPFLVVDTPGKPGHGLMLRDADGKPQAFDMEKQAIINGMQADITPALFGEYTAPDGRPVKTVMTLLAEKYLDEQYAPENAAKVCGLSAETIERLALEMAHVAFKETIEIDCEWTDWAGRKQTKFIGRPVSMHAMRGISAHSNGFQAARAIHLLQVLLGTIDVPGGFRSKAPYPKHVPPPVKPARDMAPNTPLKSPPLGFPTAPEDLVIDAQGNPLRIDKAYSWEAPLANHGLMHMVVTNAVNADPYAIDTLIFFMANMSWNSTMNTKNVMDMLRSKGEDGEYKIPFLVVVDAFQSEIVSFADLVLPDTTYLERYDAISLLDRPISEPDAPADSIRHELIKPDRNVRPWQEVMIDIAGRLKFPAFTKEDGTPKFAGYKDFIINYQKSPGIGFLAGWRGKDGESHMVGEPNPLQWEKYIENGGFFQYHLPKSMHYYKFANRDYLEWAKKVGFNGSSDPIVFELYSETLQKFRLAGQGLYDGPKPTDPADRERLVKYFDPLPDFYKPLEEQRVDEEEYPFHAINQRPMMMYHSWDAQNAWLRQIVAQNFLYMNREQGERMGIQDQAWVWVESHNGKIRVQVKLMEGVQENTVWTWNAIGKQSGAWGLKDTAPEATRGFLMNHLISELLPAKQGERRLTNSDPVTGQAAWYDLRVKVYPAAPGEEGVWPTFETVKRVPGQEDPVDVLRYHTHKPVNLKS